jgi:hypothetical protein
VMIFPDEYLVAILTRKEKLRNTHACPANKLCIAESAMITTLGAIK